MQNDTQPMILADDLKFAYIGEEGKMSFALNGITTTVQKGEFLAVLGHNGSGKSTFSKHMNALLVPSAGKVTVDGMDTAQENNQIAIRKKAGMVFQNPDNQLVATVVEEDVAFGPENLGVPQPEIVERVEKALKTVAMENYAKRAPHMLSGGQKQRVAIAGVLAISPEVIIFDEPTAMLDPNGREEVMKTVRYLNQKEGKTIVYITHFMEEAADADRVIVLKDGLVFMEGTPHEIFIQREKLEEAGLKPPFATQIYYDLKAAGIDLPKCPITTEEMVEELCRLL